MKKLSLISLAAAAVLAISPAALVAQQVDFTFTTDNGAASGTGIFDITEVGTSDVYQISLISGTFTDTNNGLALTNESIASLYPASYSSSSPTVVGSLPVYADNLFYPTGGAPSINGSPAGGVLDTYGLLFTLANGDLVNVTGLGANDGPEMSVIDSTGSRILDQGDDRYRYSVPEYGTLSMLALSFVGLGAGFFFKARQSGLLLNA
jgi:hypothetical protein